MDSNFVRPKLFEVLMTIQSLRRLDCPALTGDIKPADDLPKFDSKLWPVAVGMLATAIGVPLPNDANIFKAGRRTLTIDEATAIVCRLVEKPNPAKKAG